MFHIRTAYKYIVVLLAGIVIFFLDDYNIANDSINAGILFTVSIVKAFYFFRFTFGRIRETAHLDFEFYDFAKFAVFNITLIILSFSLDFYCLYRIDGQSFAGVPAATSIAKEFMAFLYFSVSTFTTTGYGDIRPNGPMAQLFVMTELLNGYFYTLLIISNVLHIREFVLKKNNN